MPSTVYEEVHPPVVDRLRVAIRERPVADADVSQVQVNFRTDEEKLIAFSPGEGEGLMYDYDYYFPSTTRQDDLYRTIGLEMVEVVMGGLSTNCIAFGSTDTGKTHTLFGSENEAGLIQDTVRALFARLEGQVDQHEYRVSLRYWEMSCNGVLDNLSDDAYEAAYGDGGNGGDAKALHSIFRDGFGRLYVARLTEVDVSGYDEFEFFLNVGHARRIQRGSNRHSRWHGFVQLNVTTTDRARGERCVMRQMTFAHLKGSDRAGEKGARGTFLRECSAINVSVTLLCAGVIHSLEYRRKRARQSRSKEALHELIQKSESFFMECRFSLIMAQLMGGHEASFVVGCVNPLNYSESVDTLENLQLFRQLTCACVPVVTSSEKGRLMRRLRKLEQSFGGADVLDSVYKDTTGRPLTEEEEELLRLRGQVEGWPERSPPQQQQQQQQQQAGSTRAADAAQRGTGTATATAAASTTTGTSARKAPASAASRSAGKATAVTHGDRGKIYLNAAKTATYEGQWADGEFEGFGEHIRPKSKYRGEFRAGQREGEGTLFVRDTKEEPYRRIYQGEWVAGKRDGRGTQWTDNGEVYEGHFSEDRRHGNGRLFLPNGDVIEGSFRNDVAEGWAVLTTAGGDWFEGYWSLGMREGPGIWHYVKRKQSLKGEWSKNISVMGVFEDNDDKMDDSCSGFIPRVSVMNYEAILLHQRDRLNERRTREYAAKGLKWVDYAAEVHAAAAASTTTGDVEYGSASHTAGLDVE